MSGAGFQLVRIALTGPDVVDAEVQFDSGLNVITGPSDTGKTFILQCIDFMLGARDRPEEIPEAKPYDNVFLTIRPNHDSTEMTFRRALGGGAFELSVDGGEDRILGERHSADNQDTLSHVLLTLTHLAGKRIRKNVRGETQSLSFRNLAHLIVVSEEDVIRVRSPLETGQHISRTTERSVFRLLLSGIDDSAVVARDDRSVSRVRTEAKVEVLQVLVERTQQEVAELEIEDDLAALQEQLGRLDATYAEATDELNALQDTVATVEERRRGIWQRLRQVESRMDVLSELDTRFALLDEQYASDLRRLDAIGETGTRLDEMPVERCPVCGAPAEHHDEEHQSTGVDPAIVAEACAAEAQKIRALIADLAVTLRDVRGEAGELTTEKRDRQAALEAVGNEISDQLKPRMRDVLQRVRDGQEQRGGVSRAVKLLEELAELEVMIADVQELPTRAPSAIEGREINAADIEAFAMEVESRLQAWNFPAIDRVTFSEEDWDIIISGSRRTSHGKGVRAVTHAAFTIALLRYCVNQELPHPGFVVIDSPLVVYREPDTDEEGFNLDLKASFFKDLAGSFGDAQVIILENEEPPTEVAEDASVNIIKFTGTSTGRRGFIPTVASHSE